METIIFLSFSSYQYYSSVNHPERLKEDLQRKYGGISIIVFETFANVRMIYLSCLLSTSWLSSWHLRKTGVHCKWTLLYNVTVQTNYDLKYRIEIKALNKTKYFHYRCSLLKDKLCRPIFWQRRTNAHTLHILGHEIDMKKDNGYVIFQCC